MLRKKASKGRLGPQLKNKLNIMFGDQADQVIEELKSGKMTDNIKYLAFNTLLDFQPVALSEMPQKYLDSPNGRIFYQLKTFSIKALDVFRREGIQKIKSKDPKVKRQGWKDLMRLTTLFVLLNATADEIKDWIFNRDSSMTDRMIDNLMRLVGLSKYFTWQIRKEGAATAVLKLAHPPTDIVNVPLKDLDEIFRKLVDGKPMDVDVKRMRSWKLVPFVGKNYYWWFGRGAEFTRKDLRSRLLKESETRKFSKEESDAFIKSIRQDAEDGKITDKTATRQIRKFDNNQITL